MYKGRKEDAFVIPLDDDDEDIDSILQESDQTKLAMYPSLGSSDPKQDEKDEGQPMTLEVDQVKEQPPQATNAQKPPPVPSDFFESFGMKGTGLIGSNMTDSKSSTHSNPIAHFMSFGSPDEVEQTQIRQSPFGRGTFGPIDEEPAHQSHPIAQKPCPTETNEPKSKPQTDQFSISLDNNSAQKETDKLSSSSEENDRVPSFGTSSGESKPNADLWGSEWSNSHAPSPPKQQRESPTKNLNKVMSNPFATDLNNSTTIAIKIPSAIRPPVSFNPEAQAGTHQHHIELPETAFNTFDRIKTHQPPPPLIGPTAQKEPELAIDSDKNESLGGSVGEETNQTTSVDICSAADELELRVGTTRQACSHVLNQEFIKYMEQYFQEQLHSPLPITTGTLFKLPLVVQQEYFIVYFDYVQRVASAELATFMESVNGKSLGGAAKKEKEGWFQQAFNYIASYQKLVVKRTPSENLERLLSTLIFSCEKSESARAIIQETTGVLIDRCPLERSELNLRAKVYAFIEFRKSLSEGQRHLQKCIEVQRTGTKNQPRHQLYSRMLTNYLTSKQTQDTRARTQISRLLPLVLTGGR